MNLYFRLLKLILLRFLKPRPMGLLDISAIHGRVWINDLDNNFHMNNGRYLTLMDLGRLDIVLCAGLLGTCLKKRWFPVVGALKIQFFRPLEPFQKFELKTRILGWDAKWLYLEQWFEVDGKCCAKAHLQGLFKGPDGKVATKELLQAAGIKKKSPKLPIEIRKWLRPSR
jgi:acyl-CoA thioesterase FadM